MNGSEREQWTGLRSDLEQKLRDAISLNEQMRSQLDSLHDEKERNERELKSQVEAISKRASGVNGWESRYETLDKTHQDLRSELSRQEKVTNEVRNDAADLLRHLRDLSQRTDQNIHREEELVQRVQQLENEAREWKSRYAKAKTQGRNMRTGSVALPTSDARQLGQEPGFCAPDGRVSDLLVTRFQLSIDELLHTARTNDPGQVLVRVKMVTTAVRNIILAVGGNESVQREQGQQLSKLRSKISATASNLITAAKNFAISDGVLPVSLLDAAASHLSTSIVGLLRLVKIRPTPPSELEHEEDANSIIADSPADYYSFSHTRSNTRDNAVYSLPYDTQGTQGNAPEGNLPTNGLPNGNNHHTGSLPANIGKIEELKV